MSAIAFVGNAATAPELAFTPAQKPFVRLLVAENQGHRNRETGEWVEDEATFWPVTLWGEAAQNVAASVKRGDRVIVVGRTRTSAWTTDEGDRRSRVEVVADEIGASTRFARLTIAKVLRTEPSDSPAAPALAGAHAASGGSGSAAPF